MTPEDRDSLLRAWWDQASVLADEAERLDVVPHLVATLQRRCRVHAPDNSFARFRGRGGWCAVCGWRGDHDPFAALLTPPAELPDEG